MNDSANDKHRLARRLGLIAATMTGLGVIIGSGIYVILGVAAGPAGNAVWLSFILAAFGAGLTAFSYARLARLRPGNAPEYQFVGGAFGKFPGFLAGWLILVAQVVSATAVALGFAGYFHALTGIPELPTAVGLIVLCSFIIYIGISQSAGLASLLTVVEIVGLLIIIVIGLPRFGSVDYFEMPSGIAGVFTAASLVFFAYLGFEGIANLSEEMRDPDRDLPRAIILAVLISTLFYVLVAVAAVSVLGWRELSATGAPFTRIAEQAFGNRAGLLLTLISLASTGNTVLILLLAGSRIITALSAARVLPGAFAWIDPRRRTPWLAIAVVGLTAIAFVLLEDIQRVAEFTNFTTLLAFGAVNLSALRLLDSETGQGLKAMVLNRAIPVLALLFSLWLAINAGVAAAFFGAAVLGFGALIYWLRSIAAKHALK